MQINSFNKINILDLSFNGKLDPTNARFFNKITDQILKEYVESINALSSKQIENVNWFLTPFFGRNTFICNVFKGNLIGFIYLLKSLLILLMR